MPTTSSVISNFVSFRNQQKLRSPTRWVPIGDQFGCQASACHLGVFTDARIIHFTLLETLTNPTIASRQREHGSGEKVYEGGKGKGTKWEIKGFDRSVLLQDEGRDDVENQLYACPSERGYFLFRTAGVLSRETRKWFVKWSDRFLLRDETTRRANNCASFLDEQFSLRPNLVQVVNNFHSLSFRTWRMQELYINTVYFLFFWKTHIARENFENHIFHNVWTFDSHIRCTEFTLGMSRLSKILSQLIFFSSSPVLVPCVSETLVTRFCNRLQRSYIRAPFVVFFRVALRRENIYPGTEHWQY